MIIKNAKIYTSYAKFERADIRFSEKIEEMGHIAGEGLDAKGLYLVPGFIDIHTHGAMGADFCDASRDALETLSLFYASRGVTSYCATTISYDEATLERVMRVIAGFSGSGARCIGINMEGPFLNPEKKGAHVLEHLIPPDFGMFLRLYNASSESITFVEVAPEIDEGFDFIKKASGMCRVSLAHTTASYDTAMRAFSAGADHVTHLFNAMSAYHQFDPGVIGAAADSGAYVEVICDGIHIHPSVIRSIFRMFPKDRICLISDSMRGAGMPDGDYSLGGLHVIIKNRKAALENGTIAGSTISVADAVRNAISFGIDPEYAIAAATINPARSAGIDSTVGSIEPGKKADLLLLDEAFNVKNVYISGSEFAL